MKLKATPIRGLYVTKTTTFSDERGAFSRFFCENELADAVGSRGIVQINHSRTTSIGAIRGLHYQRVLCAEMKLVRCIRGRVWDVAVDLRHGAPTFLQWHAEELTPENGLMIIIPEGFAHGFQVLEENSELLYLHTAFYKPDAEGGVRFDDPAMGIDWPLRLTDISERDRSHPLIDADFQGLKV